MRILYIGAVLSFGVAGVTFCDDDYRILSQRTLSMPIRGLTRHDIQDTFKQSRAGGKAHEATDILAPRGTPVLAMEDGVIQKLFLSKPGGLTIYEFDHESIFCYYYAHLERYRDGLREGMQVHRGEVIGYVGTTGNASGGTPHLHLAIFKLLPEKRWWQGTAIDPYPLLMNLLSCGAGPRPAGQNGRSGTCPTLDRELQ